MSDQDLPRGFTVLVTGGTGGIGLATAAGLAGLGARVGIVGRSATRGAVAADTVRRKAPYATVDVFEADLSAQGEVRRLAAEVRRPTRASTSWSTASAATGRTGTAPRTASSAPSRSTTSLRSSSPTS